jgi:hypothetical protein
MAVGIGRKSGSVVQSGSFVVIVESTARTAGTVGDDAAKSANGSGYESSLPGAGNGLGAILRAQLAIDIAGVALHGSD